MKRIQRVFGDVDALRFVDDRLGGERRAAFAAHLKDDPDMAARVRLWARQNEALRAAYAPVAAEPVPIWLRLRQLETRSPAPDFLVKPQPPLQRSAKVARLGSRQRSRPATLRGRLAGAALATLAIAAFSVVAARSILLQPAFVPDEQGGGGGNAAPALVARAEDAFRTFAIDPIRPVELAANDDIQLDRWVSRRLMMPVHAPDLRANGWALLGGRLTPGELGPAAYFVYDDGANERMGLYIARTNAPAHAKPTPSTVAGGASLSWVKGSIGYVLTAGKSEAWMLRNADAFVPKVEAGMSR